MPKYNYHLIVTDELGNVIVELKKGSFEMIAESERAIQLKLEQHEEEEKRLENYSECEECGEEHERNVSCAEAIAIKQDI